MDKPSLKIKSSVRGQLEKGEKIHFSDIRPSRAVYFLAYALELIFYSVRGMFMPIGFSVGGIKGWTVIQAVHMFASLLVMLLWSEKFKYLLRGSVFVMLAGFIPYIFFQPGFLRFVFGMIGYAGLGGVVTGARCGYAFVANNAERFFGIIFMYFSVLVVRFFGNRIDGNLLASYILPIVLLALLSFCLFRFREEDFEVKEEANEGDTKGLQWAFVFFIVYFMFEGYNSELTEIGSESYNYKVLGMLISGLLLAVVFCGFRFSTWHLWNLFLLLAIGMGLFALLAPKIGTEKPEYFFCGLSYLGWPLCIYTMGCAQRRFASYKLLKKCTVIFVLLTPVTSLPNDIIASCRPDLLPIVTLCVALTVTIGMLMVSPFSYKHLFSSMWISDIYKPDMALLQEKIEETDRFEKYGLTPRQKEIAMYLLAAKTRRQIAGELGLSESTVKMHTSELYKRLGINSRVELFRIFGVAEEAENTQEK